MTNEQIKSDATKMDTPALANWLQNLVEEKRGLKGLIVDTPENLERSAYIKRYIRIIAQELSSRQVMLKGF